MKILPILGSAMSGSMRGVTASHNRGGAYLRGRTVPVNPSSTAQGLLRTAVASVTAQWSSVLTQLQRDGWDLYADNVSWTDKLGQDIRLSGVNQYVRSAGYAAYVAAALGETPPTVLAAPPIHALGIAPVVDSLALANGAGPPATQDLTITWANTGDYNAQDLLVVHLGGSQNPGVNFFKGPYIVSGSAAANAGTVAIDLLAAPYADRYPSVDEGRKLWGYARVLHEDGRLSSEARFGPVFGPAP